MQLAAALVMACLAVVFISLLRSALRHGAVPSRGVAFDPDAPPPTELLPATELPRAYFRVGSPVAFYACAGGMVACAFALTVLGGAYELLHHRIGVVFVTMATLMLALFGLSAYGASETIPLDVAIDAQGVTLAGSRTPWRTIVSLSVDTAGKRAWVVLHTTERVVRLGPASNRDRTRDRRPHPRRPPVRMSLRPGRVLESRMGSSRGAPAPLDRN